MSDYYSGAGCEPPERMPRMDGINRGSRSTETRRAVNRRGIGLYVKPGVMRCHAKVRRPGEALYFRPSEWCQAPADYYAMWARLSRGGPSVCTRPLCEYHAAQWCHRYGLTLPTPEQPQVLVWSSQHAPTGIPSRWDGRSGSLGRRGFAG